MSRAISTIAVEEFSARAHQTYQGSSKLRNTVRIERGVVGTKKHFPVVGKVRASPVVPRAELVPSGISYTRPEAELTDWHVAELTSIFEQATTNVNERQVLADSFAYAIGRQEDQFIIDSLEDAGSGFETVALGSVQSTTKFDPEARPAPGHHRVRRSSWAQAHAAAARQRVPGRRQLLRHASGAVVSGLRGRRGHQPSGLRRRRSGEDREDHEASTA